MKRAYQSPHGASSIHHTLWILKLQHSSQVFQDATTAMVSASCQRQNAVTSQVRFCHSSYDICSIASHSVKDHIKPLKPTVIWICTFRCQMYVFKRPIFIRNFQCNQNISIHPSSLSLSFSFFPITLFVFFAISSRQWPYKVVIFWIIGEPLDILP